jgi:metallophosphoesterase superfamily enzyme
MSAETFPPEWIFTPQRVAVHRPTRTGIVADLHLGYDLALLHGGDAIPVDTHKDRLAPLRDVVLAHAVRHLVIAGDFVESRHAREAVPPFLDAIRAAGIESVGLVPGNHDHGLSVDGLPVFADGIQVGQWHVTHGDGAFPAGHVVHGHSHPYLHWTARVGGPCYLFRETCLVLPAYSDDIAGTNVLEHGRWRNFRCWVVAGDAVLGFGKVGLMRQIWREGYAIHDMNRKRRARG